MTKRGVLAHAVDYSWPMTHQPEEMILLLSDLQPGLRTPTYNTDEFKRRLERLTDAVLRLHEIHSTDRRIDVLHIAALGDFIEGEPFTRRINLAELDVSEVAPFDILAQKRLVVDECETMLKRFADVFRRVHWVGVYGNHGANRDRTASKRSNDDTEVYYSLSDRFRTSTCHSFDIEPLKFYQVFEVAGHPFLAVHGHQVKMWQRTPLYGIANMVILWKQVIPEEFRYVLMGHFHSLNYIDAVGTPVYLNGAFVDDDEYCMSRGLKPSANQWVIGVHPKYGATWERRLWLKS